MGVASVRKVVLVAVLMLASGCVGRVDVGPVSASTQPVAAGAEGVPIPPTPPVDPGFSGMPYTLGCKQSRLFFSVPLEQAQNALPKGWKAADARELHRLVGLPDPGADTKMGLVGYDAAECPTSTLDGKDAPVEFSNIGVAIVTPDLPGRPALTPANFELYDVDLVVKGDAWFSLAQRTGFGSRAPGAEMTVELGSAPGGGGGPGSAKVDAASQTLAAFSWMAPAAAPHSISLVRFWHESDRGTAYFEVSLTDKFGPSPVTACSHAADSPHRRVTGVADCNGAAAMVLTGSETLAKGTSHWLPGVRPTAPTL